eukprot:1479060-Pyramimonas_sp.AAC.1
MPRAFAIRAACVLWANPERLTIISLCGFGDASAWNWRPGPSAQRVGVVRSRRRRVPSDVDAVG